MENLNINKKKYISNFYDEKTETNNSFFIFKRNNLMNFFSEEKIIKYILRIAKKIAINIADINFDLVINEVKKNIFNNINTINIFDVIATSLSTLIENDYIYNKLGAVVLIEKIIKKNYKVSIKNDTDYEFAYRKSFLYLIKKSVEEELLDKKLLEFDLIDLSNYLKLDRDSLFEYNSIFNLEKRYFLITEDKNVESPQGFWMRISMGLAINEKNKQEKAKEFYDILSKMLYIPSTPTLFHAGYETAQLSSCYVSIVNDDLSHIFKVYSDSAQLGKWSGGVGTSWSHLRASGSYIKKVRLYSGGIIPYLKIEDDIVSAISKTGIRRGGKAVYLDTWHSDVEEFIDLRKNTGDHRRRTHDLNTALWISDLFMKRVKEDKTWTLFSPLEVPLLLSTYGKEFEENYIKYESLAKEGKIKLKKEISAKEFWKKILMRIFETGHPWLTFKDAFNIRSTQSHCGMIYSSNLCTEIGLNSSENETAVCNLGSINLANHLDENGAMDYDLLKNTIKVALRMLDNVIDISFYPVVEAKNANVKHRPIGLGIAGWQDVLFKKKMSFIDKKSIELADRLMEFISYNAINESSDLAIERGKYESFCGSKWDQGLMPFDTIEFLEKERGFNIEIDKSKRLDWDLLKSKIKKYGIRNSNLMAIAPTATISSIVGVFPSIEPVYKNLYVKTYSSGEFTIINKYLVDDLKKLKLWTPLMIEKIKFNDGSIQNIAEIPENIKKIYLTAFEIDQRILIDMTAVRGKWIDQSQSHNIFFASTSGKELSDLYFYAWEKGLKSTYYLRSLGKSQIEKSTLDAKVYGFTQIRNNSEKKNSCSLDESECESCQ